MYIKWRVEDERGWIVIPRMRYKVERSNGSDETPNHLRLSTHTHESSIIMLKTSHSPRFALATHFSELVANNILANAESYL